MRDENRVVLEFPARRENAGLARLVAAQVAAQMGFRFAEVEEIKVAVSEAVNNAIVHGYSGTGAGTVRVEVAARGDELEVVVEDRGRGMADVAGAKQQAQAGDPDHMGLGFLFMESFMDRVEVASAPGQGTRVVMRKRVGSAAEEPAVAPGSK